MDERQQQIRERAGLEEARYNLEFIDWLRKWGVPILLVFAIVAVTWQLRERYVRAQAVKLDESFGELNAVVSGNNPSPESLLQIAADYEGSDSAVPLLAKMEAADAYLDAIRRGIRPGVQPNTDGTLAQPEDALSEADRATFLAKAGDLYQDVYAKTKADPARQLLAVGALYGMAAVNESRPDLAKAQANYEEIVRLAEASGFAPLAAVAEERIGELDKLKTVPPVYSKADLPPVPEPPPAPAPTLTPIDLPPFLQPSGPPPGMDPAEPAPSGAQPLLPPVTPPAEPAPQPAEEPAPR